MTHIPRHTGFGFHRNKLLKTRFKTFSAVFILCFTDFVKHTFIGMVHAFRFFYIMYLETFATTSDKTSKVFGMSRDELERKSVNTLFKNQGVYNGLLAVMILLAVFVFASKPAVMVLMGYIVLVALYGGITSNPKIIIMQGGLAILALLSALF